MPRKMISEEVRNKQRQEIIEIATELYAQKGVEATTIEDIADRVKRSDNFVLRLFRRRKEAIADAVFHYHWTKVNTVIREVMADRNINAKDKILSIFRKILMQTKHTASFGTNFITQGKIGGEPGQQFVRTGLADLANLIDRDRS